MKTFLAPNIGGKGRLFRGIWAVLLLVGAAFAFRLSVWLGGVLLASAGFALFEALRAWCLLRACGIKTKF